MSGATTFNFDVYEDVHRNPQGPGDSRPTALEIIKDEDLAGKLEGKVILVIGASSGIGIETVRALAVTGATVVMGTRNMQKGQNVLDKIVDENTMIQREQLELLQMDLNSLESVREASKIFLSKYKQLNVLVDNAGIAGVAQGTTADGFESHFGVNHLSHFLLFQLLQPLLSASSSPSFQSRVIVVSSAHHRTHRLQLADPNFRNTPYDPAHAYASSKVANIWFANELERRYGASGVHAISLHPGGIETGLQDHHDEQFQKGMEELMTKFPDLKDIYLSIEQGAASTVLAAVGKAFEGRGGFHVENCQVAKVFDPEKQKIYEPGYAEYAFDPEGERQLWEMSLDMVGLGKEKGSE